MKFTFIAIISLFIFSVGLPTTQNAPQVNHQIWLSLHPDSQMLYGVDTISIGAVPVDFYLTKQCEVSVTALNEVHSIETRPSQSDQPWLKNAHTFTLSANEKYVIHWNGTFRDTGTSAINAREQVADVPGGVIGLEGIYLSPSALYYPYSEQSLHTYNVVISTPSNWIPITTGLRKKVGVEADGMIRWDFGGPYILDGLTVTAGQYVVKQTDTLGIVVETCFTEKRKDLSDTYLLWAKKYIARYSHQIGSYPFPSFSMVEAFFSAGFGMPGYTFLGSDVIALPFIVQTSLGHEVLHNWWGNGVFVKGEDGNWCEGLATYGADWAYKAEQGDSIGTDYRRSSIKSFVSYVNDGNDFPLSEFTSRSSGATRAVGYNKSSFLFHSLKQKIGKDAFEKGLQRFYSDHKFQYAGWKDIQKSFEQVSNQSLETFFSDWLTSKGASTITLDSYSMDKKHLNLKLTVGGSPMPEQIPIEVFSNNSNQLQWYPVKNGQNLIKIPFKDKPTVFSIDPYFECWRMPAQGEIAPTLSDLYGSKVVQGVLTEVNDSDYRKSMEELAKVLFDSVVWVDRPTDNFPTTIIFGKPEQVFQKKRSVFYSLGKTNINSTEVEGGSVLSITDSNGLLVGLISAPALSDIQFLKRKAPHYGKYSFIGFNKEGTNVVKGNWQVNSHSLRVQTVNQ